MLQAIDLKVISIVVNKNRERRNSVDSTVIAEELGESPDHIADILAMLEEDGYVTLVNAFGGYCAAFPTSKANLTIDDPAYMEKRISGTIILDALIEAVEKSEDISKVNQKSLIDKIKAVKDDPYLVTIGGGVLLEALKKYVGL
jgi:predicted transcriptional regulator